MSDTLRIDGHLDWLTATMNRAGSAGAIIPSLPGVDILKEVKPPPRFDRAFEVYPSGIIAHQHTGHKTAMLVLKGKDLTAWRQADIPDEFLIAALQHTGVRITRVDYCLNVRGEGSVDDCRRHLGYGFRTGRPKPYADIRGLENNGDTLYFGSPKSAQRITVYDKAAELKLLNEIWVRMEARIRKPHASPLVTDMHTKGLHAAGRQKIRTLCDFPQLEWWQNAVVGKELDMTKVPRQPKDVIKWLYAQVMPTFEKRHDEQTLKDLNMWLSEANMALRAANTPLDDD